MWEWRIDRRSEAGGGEEEEEDMGREEWRGLSGIIRERGGSAERTNGEWLDGTRPGSERADGAPIV